MVFGGSLSVSRMIKGDKRGFESGVGGTEGRGVYVIGSISAGAHASLKVPPGGGGALRSELVSSAKRPHGAKAMTAKI